MLHSYFAEEKTKKQKKISSIFKLMAIHNFSNNKFTFFCMVYIYLFFIEFGFTDALSFTSIYPASCNADKGRSEKGNKRIRERKGKKGRTLKRKG